MLQVQELPGRNHIDNEKSASVELFKVLSPLGRKTHSSWKWRGILLYTRLRDLLKRGRELAVTVWETGQRSNQLNYVPNRGINDLP